MMWGRKTMLKRASFIALAMAALVFTAIGTPTCAAALGDGNAQWAQLVAAAKGQKLTVLAMTGSAYSDMLDAFQKDYPDITLEATQARPGDSTTRVVTEQENGQYLWDVFWGPSNNLNAVLVPAKALQIIDPFFVLPEVTDDKNWRGGFALYSQDITKQHLAFLAQMTVGTGGFAVNWDKAAKDSLKNWQDLLDPRWRGKIAIYDPTRPVTGAIDLACALPVVGIDYIMRLFHDQALVANNDARLITDWLVRGRYPVVIGLSGSFLPNYQKQGLGKNIDVAVGDTVCRGLGGPSIAVLKNAPHREAATVFINWLASREGQEVYAKTFWPFDQSFSRRTDVAVPDAPEAKAAVVALDGGKAIAAGSETHAELMKQVVAVAKQNFN
jgi:iron(III) transport system substrate-binding protein